MLVQFNPMVNSGASADASYMNFLRCVRAIATAAAGTSSITVNPFTNNTGTIDGTRNCITTILANTEAGGWTESASSNVVQSGAFTSMQSVSAYTYKFDAYVASGKGQNPYVKFSCTGMPGGYSTTYYGSSNPYSPGSAQYGPMNNQYQTPGAWMFTFGYSTTNDWTDTKYPPGGGNFSIGDPTSGTGSPTTKSSVTFMAPFEQSGSYYSPNAWVYYGGLNSSFCTFDANKNFWMACTANYVIIWESHTSNNYLNGYATTIANTTLCYSQSNYVGAYNFGSIIACGFREAQAWENSYSNNPPIYAMFVQHNRASYRPNNFLWAPMLTQSDAGIVNTTLGIGMLRPTSPGFTSSSMCINNTTDYFGYLGSWNISVNPTGGIGGYQSLDQPILMRENYQDTHSNQMYKPGVDNTTGLAVPTAFPIIIRKSTSGAWNPGGAARGIYKSLSMPIATMRNYFANGQTFNIYNSTTGVTDVYYPIVFNEDMWLVRYA